MELPHTREVYNGRLWFATLGSAIAWALHLTLAYPLVGFTCRVGSTLALWLMSAGTLAVSLGSLGVAWYEGRRLREPHTPVEHRGRFMARVGFWLGVIFSIVISMESLPILYMGPCLDFRLERQAWRVLRGAGLLLVGYYPNAALAHVPAGPVGPQEAFASWSLDPFLLVALLAGVGGFARGLRAVWRRAGVGQGVSRGQAACLGAGLLALAWALLSPLDTVGAVLFSAHMLQHMVLMLVAAPLLALGRPGYTLLWALPLRVRRGLARVWQARGLRPWLRVLGSPLVLLALHTAAVWAWHLPALYNAALASNAVHALEHACFLGTALLFWWRVRTGAGSGAALLYVFAAALQSGALGVLMSLAPTAWYPVQARGAAGWGLTALEDQQLAGLLMWVPGNGVYLVAALGLTHAWLRAAEQRSGTRGGGCCLPEDARRPVGGALPRVVPLGVLLVATGVGCQEGAGPPRTAMAQALPRRLRGDGMAGHFHFELELRPAVPAVGTLFEVYTTLREVESGAPLGGARVVVDASMPEHAHGMVTRPEHEELGEGCYLSRGMRLHMPGRWQLHLRAALGGKEDTLSLEYEQPARVRP